MGVNINGGLNIGSGRTLISAPYVPPPSFNFTFNQQRAASGFTITSISGFTSAPAFTSTSNAFTFNSTGSPVGIIVFSFIATSDVSVSIAATLYKNGEYQEEIADQVISVKTFTFGTTNVLANDTILITTATVD